MIMWREVIVSTAPVNEAALQDRMRSALGDIGAIATFTGVVSEQGEGSGVHALELEHYAGMTEAALGTILDQAAQRWPLQAAMVCHRVGRMLPGESIVFVATASRHRGAAFDACRFIMDCLKTDAPFWKKEYRDGDAHWVSPRDSDDHARRHWDHAGELPGQEK